MQPLSVVPSLPCPTTKLAWTKQEASRIRHLVEAYHRFVWRSLARLGVEEPDVDDACQQVFWVAARRLERVEPDKERSFLFGTAVRVASDYRRTKHRRKEVSEAEMGLQVDSKADPEQAVDSREALMALDAILDAMPDDLRVIFLLYEIEEMQMSEIAQWLEIPQGTVASRLRRARADFHLRAQRLQAASQNRMGR